MPARSVRGSEKSCLSHAIGQRIKSSIVVIMKAEAVAEIISQYSILCSENANQ